MRLTPHCFRDTEDKDIRMPRALAPFRGTTRYASIAALKQIEQSRKDDIEVARVPPSGLIILGLALHGYRMDCRIPSVAKVEKQRQGGRLAM